MNELLIALREEFGSGEARLSEPIGPELVERYERERQSRGQGLAPGGSQLRHDISPAHITYMVALKIGGPDGQPGLKVGHFMPWSLQESLTRVYSTKLVDDPPPPTQETKLREAVEYMGQWVVWLIGADFREGLREIEANMSQWAREEPGAFTVRARASLIDKYLGWYFTECYDAVQGRRRLPELGLQRRGEWMARNHDHLVEVMHSEYLHSVCPIHYGPPVAPPALPSDRRLSRKAGEPDDDEDGGGMGHMGGNRAGRDRVSGRTRWDEP